MEGISKRRLCPLPAEIPRSRLLNYSGYVQASVKQYAAAIDTYRKLQHEYPTDPICAQEALRGLYRCYIAMGDLENCVALVIRTYLRARPLLTPIRLIELLEHYESSHAPKDAGHIGWPILYHVYYVENGISRNNYKIYIAYDNFLLANGVERPSELITPPPTVELDAFIYFLRYVCVPDVLDYSYHLEGSESLEVERIKVCQILLNLDRENAETYSSEIRSLTRQSMVRHAMQLVDETKVYVDTARIKEVLEKTLPRQFERLLTISAMRDEKMRRILLVRRVSLTPDHQHLVFTDAGLESFREMFLQIRNHFISNNEYGLDSYLSIRVRHGTIEGQVRSVFERLKLITRMGKDSTYNSNKEWYSRIDAIFGERIAREVDARLGKFSAEIDSMVEKVKTKWIQIRGKSNEFEGLFNFDYEDSELQTLYLRMSKITSYDEFVGATFEALWERTSENLAVIRKRVRGVFLDDMLRALSMLEQDIDGICGGEFWALPSAIIQCRTDLQHAVNVVSGWFNLPDKRSLPDYDIEDLLNTAVQYIRRLFPSHEIEPSIHIGSSIRCRGATFPYFVDIAFILLENVVKYSDRSDISPEVRVGLDSGALQICVSNSIPASTDKGELNAKLQRIRGKIESMSAARKEGETGFVKLHKLIRFDLAARDVDITFGEQDGIFTVQARFSFSGIAA